MPPRLHEGAQAGHQVNASATAVGLGCCTGQAAAHVDWGLRGTAEESGQGPAVSHKHFIGQVLGGRPGKRAGQVQEAVGEQSGVTSQDVTNFVRGLRELAGGGQESAPPRRVAVGVPVGGQGVEDSEQPIQVIAGRNDVLVPDPLPVRQPDPQHFGHQGILAAEVRIQGGRGDLRLAQQIVHRRVPDAAFEQYLIGRLKQPDASRGSLGGGHDVSIGNPYTER